MLKKIIEDLRSQKWAQILINKSNVYVVGGSVRDSFLNKPLKDIDLVVEGLTIDEVKNLIKPYGKINVVGESFVVIKFRPKGHIGEDYDIAVCRKDRKTGTGHKDFDVETKGVTILEDLKRRDITINSIAADIRTAEILDPFNGIDDLKRKILRATDANAFTEDALRIIRAVQFAARFDFAIEPRTLKMMKENSYLLKEISGERILEEFEKILHKSGNTKLAFEIMHETDIDKALFGKKFITDEFDSFDKLDPISFYFILGTLGNTSPTKFYTSVLKTNVKNEEGNMTKALTSLEKYFSKFDLDKPEEEIRWNVLMMLKGSLMIQNAVILPPNVKKIIWMMKIKKIPMKFGDIPVSGTEIMEKFNIPEGRELGILISKMYKDALMNKFDWKNKNKTLNYLNKYI